MEELIIIVLGLAGGLAGALQLYQRAITKKGDMQEKLNDEILELSMENITIEGERDYARQLAMKYKQKLKEESSKRLLLVSAVKTHATPGVLAKIRDEINKI